MYSHDVISMVASREFSLSIAELNWIMSTSPQARYEIISEEEKDTKIRMLFTDRDGIEVNIKR